MAMAEMGEGGRRLFDHSSCYERRRKEKESRESEREGGRERERERCGWMNDNWMNVDENRWAG